jgi:transcriptional regulator with XRE-family HTH domain
MFFRKKTKLPEPPKIDTKRGAEMAQKIRYLFDTYKNSEGEKHSYEELEKATGIRISDNWLLELTEGKVVRPGIDFYKSISGFFDVHPSLWIISLEEWIDRQNNPRSSQMLVRTRSGCVPLEDLPANEQQQMIELMDSLEKEIILERAAKISG